MKSHSEEMEEQLEPRPEPKRVRVLMIGSPLAAILANREKYTAWPLSVVHSEFFPAPSVHKEWIQNRVPRGTHYDPADDGPKSRSLREK